MVTDQQLKQYATNYFSNENNSHHFNEGIDRTFMPPG
ncbi:hypothetical protein DAMA08_000010, partial [Martiniozyma asiatica (nom. inval.)]